ncbi:type I restriction-modification system subunit M [Neolewinella agarilytica]|uniref:type I restriction-modification system subunit M n=1 Tax=Neolewinella agarilytica TaxID=478744 RepID=UPI002356CD14|nr:class I SAM-dependent DNA methyltransferase [Neolewinella agarilytica]
MTQQTLEKYLWGAATTLRGTIDAGDYKQYIFPLLFFKRICDVYDEEYEAALKESDGDEEYASLDEFHRFSIPEGAHWDDVRATTENVGTAIQNAMMALERANDATLRGIFGGARWTNKQRLSDETLLNLVEHFSGQNLSLANVPDDQLGNAYEYLIKEFADDSGHTAAEFYTNRTVVKLMTMLMAPEPGESVYDPTCGSGGLLLNCALHLRDEGKEYRNLKLYGQEINLLTSAIARMNMFLHGINEFSIVRGDTLQNPAFIQADGLKKFNVILANPPYSIKQWDRDRFADDPYGRNVWGTPPQGCADYAFEQHIHASMDKGNGRCVQLWPHGILFRDSEQDIRRKMIESGTVECVIALGKNLFYNSSMESALLIRRSNIPKERKGKILFINAYNEIEDHKTIAFLRQNHIDKIYSAYTEFKDIDGFAKVLDVSEVLAFDASLLVSKYLNSSRIVEDDIQNVGVAYEAWNNSTVALNESMNALFKTLQA